MYGLVNQGIRDLTLKLGGEPLWREVAMSAGVDFESIVSMDTYPDDVTYRLVDGASKVLGMSTDDVLYAFGRHWILYTAHRGFGGIFDTMGHTLPAFLGNLDAMHARLSLTMPDIKSPSFVCEQQSEHRIRLEYRSDRAGLAPMVEGMLTGLGEKFGVPLSITHTVRRTDGGDHDEFVIDHGPAASDE